MEDGFDWSIIALEKRCWMAIKIGCLLSSLRFFWQFSHFLLDNFACGLPSKKDHTIILYALKGKFDKIIRSFIQAIGNHNPPSKNSILAP